jgi:ADP-ribose diphosphatase
MGPPSVNDVKDRSGKDWAVMATEPLLDAGLFRAKRQQVISPRTGAEQRVVVIDMADWLSIVPLTTEGKLVMVRQFRHGSHTMELELPGGLLDNNDETPACGAQRELLEETGYGGGKLKSLGKLWPQPAFLSNRIWLFTINNVEKKCEQKLDAGEDIEVVLINPAEIPSRIQTGEIANAMTILALTLSQNFTGSKVI